MAANYILTFPPSDNFEGGQPVIINLESWSWGARDKGDGGGGTPHPIDLSIVKQFDKTSPGLFVACAAGTHLPKAKLLGTTTTQGGQEKLVLEVDFDNLLVDSFHQRGSVGGGNLPLEEVTFDFTSVKVVVIDGDIEGGWNFALNRSV